jgi:hypothetical protein
LAENAGHQRLYTVKEDGTVLQQSPRGVSFVLAGYSGSSQDPNYFVRLDSLDAPWTAVGPELSLWSLPPLLKTQGIDYISLSMNLVVIKYRGLRIAYICGHTAYTCIGSFVGELSENPWATWYGQPVADLRYHAPGMMPVRLEAPRVHGFSYKEVPAVYASHLIKTAKSADGTEVGFVYLQNNNQRAKALMVCGYGAYGIPSNLNTTRWKPYLERGWGIAIAFVRGGGDDSPVWADQGRRAGKLKSIEDFEAVIRICQKISHVSPKRTCIYGRSAGGYLVGSTVARHPDGDLFGGAYCEVPYVDVLRTASNPDLPLTAYEYNEFGNPREVLEDFQTLLKLSPVDALTEKGAPGVFVLCRTGTTDRQVYAYESVKWIHALRGNQKGGREKLLFITEGTGHFARGYTLAKEHAEDFLLLQERFLGGQ